MPEPPPGVGSENFMLSIFPVSVACTPYELEKKFILVYSAQVDIFRLLEVYAFDTLSTHMNTMDLHQTFPSTLLLLFPHKRCGKREKIFAISICLQQ